MTHRELQGRLLEWREDGVTFVARTPQAVAIILPHARGYHWEIFHDGVVKHHGQVRSLHLALCHVESNIVGRGMLEERREQPREECVAEAAE